MNEGLSAALYNRLRHLEDENQNLKLIMLENGLDKKEIFKNLKAVIEANAVLRFGAELKSIADKAYQDGVIQSAVAVHDVDVLCKYWAKKTLDNSKL